jgi:AraC-like DNA-binding protein
MNTEQPFLNDHFNASKADVRLGISEHHLSETLAMELNTNFYAFTNQHRLKRFDQLVRSIEFANKPVIDTAYASGYNSKTTFHRIVKKTTG